MLCWSKHITFLDEILFRQAMMRAADEVIVLADSTKFGHQSLALLCELKQIDTLVVDAEISEDWRSRILASGVRLLVAESKENNVEEQRG